MKDDLIHEAAVRQVVEAHGFDWCYRRSTESTNADVLQHEREFQREVVAFSEAQSAGRGRRGREWSSPFACNIYCTIGIAREIQANQQGLLSIVTGLALCRALKQSTSVSVGLKWPNDLIYEGRKLGGILIESRPLAENRFFFAIGFGLNVFMSDEELAEIPQAATSIARISSREPDRTEVLKSTIDQVIHAVRAFESDAVQHLITEFAGLDVYHDRTIEVLTGGDCIRGINRGITPHGQLQLETGQGIEIHSAGEISLQAVTE